MLSLFNCSCNYGENNKIVSYESHWVVIEFIKITFLPLFLDELHFVDHGVSICLTDYTTLTFWF